MSFQLCLVLIIFSLVWLIAIIYLIQKGKLPIKYSLFWLCAVGVILIISIFPFLLEVLTKLCGFKTMSNLVIGIILTLLMMITLILTILISNQKRQIALLVQTVSILKSKVDNNIKEKN